MASTGIAAVDNLFLDPNAPPIGPGSAPEAVRAIQDLLRGHGEESMPRPHRLSHGQYGPLTKKAVARFRQKNGHSPGEVVDHATLNGLAAFTPQACASAAYLALKLNLNLTPTTRIVALITQMNDGRFATIRKLGSQKGLAVGILPWLQVTKDLHQLILDYQAADPVLLANIFGGDANVTLAFNHTNLTRGGLDDEGTNALAPKMQSDLWSNRFRTAGLMQRFHSAQVTTACARFHAIYLLLKVDLLRLNSERAVAFGIDVCLQLGHSQAKAIYLTVQGACPNEKTLMMRMSKEVVSILNTKFPARPDIAREAAERHQFLIERAPLAVTTFVPDQGPPAQPAQKKFNQFFQVPDPAKGLHARQPGTSAQPFLSMSRDGSAGMAVMEQIANDINLTGAVADDFIYMLNWWCDAEMPMPDSVTSSTIQLSQLLARKAQGGSGQQPVQIRAMYWAGASVENALGVELLGLLLAAPWQVWGAVALLELAIAHKSPNHSINKDMERKVNAFHVGHPGVDAFAMLDDRNDGQFIEGWVGIKPIIQTSTHHQKVLVIRAGNRLIAYLGGIEFNQDRVRDVSGGLGTSSGYGSPLCDMTVRLEGPGAWPVLQTFVDRWRLHPRNQPGAPDPLPSMPPLIGDAAFPIPPAIITPEPVTVQITHTYGAKHPFPEKVATAAIGRANGISNAKAYFYTEDQYFIGCDDLAKAIRAAMNSSPDVIGIIVLAAEASVTDLEPIGGLRLKFLRPLVEEFGKRLLIFERVILRDERIGEGDDDTYENGINVDGDKINRGESAYIHSKVLIVDDEVAYVGSVNSSNRSWSNDSEIDAILVDENANQNPAPNGWVQNFRSQLWNRHFGESLCTGTLQDVELWKGITREIVGHKMVRRYDLDQPMPSKMPDEHYFHLVYDPIG